MCASKQTPHLLIIEDDEHISTVIRDVLHEEGFLCTQAFSGTEGKMLVTQHTFEIILLDLMLPGLSGEGFMRTLRTELGKETPVIVLSAKDTLDNKLTLFELGVDDYVTKPFEVEELLARIHVQMKRTVQLKKTTSYRHKELILAQDTMTVYMKNLPLQLTRQEYNIIELFVKHPTRVFTKQDLYELAWDDVYVGDDKTITVHISNIRNKIKAHTTDVYIETVWGIGFKLCT